MKCKLPVIRTKKEQKLGAAKEESARKKTKESETVKYLPKEWELDIPEEFWGRFSAEDEWWAFAAEEGEEESAMN